MVTMRGSPIGWGNDSELHIIFGLIRSTANECSWGIITYPSSFLGMLCPQALAWEASYTG